MDNTKSYHEQHVKSKLQTSQAFVKNVVNKSQGQITENERLPVNHKKGEDTSENTTNIKVTETYDEILDLRKAYIVNDNQNISGIDRPFDKPLNTEYMQTFSDMPKMRCKIMSLCTVKNSKKFSETFNAKTDIIAERIVSKNRELLNKEKAKPKSRRVTNKAPLFPVRLNEKCVAQRIFNTERELKKKNEKSPKKSEVNVKEARSKLLELQIPSILKKKSVDSDLGAKREVSVERYRPRFQLSTKPTGSRTRISTMSVQVNLERPSHTSICTQTEGLTTIKDEFIQTTAKETTNAKKIQTRIYKTSSIETSPILIMCPEKYTNTISAFPCSEHSTQMYEHYTMGDLFCLDWVNKHLFSVSLNPFNIVVDDKIKDVSEVASKSTFLSELQTLGFKINTF